jgi:hypothetical protein
MQQDELMTGLCASAEFMIKAHAAGAAGTAMSWALDCVWDHDAVGEKYWLAVAVLVMEMQSRAAPVTQSPPLQ